MALFGENDFIRHGFLARADRGFESYSVFRREVWRLAHCPKDGGGGTDGVAAGRVDKVVVIEEGDELVAGELKERLVLGLRQSAQGIGNLIRDFNS